MTEDEWIAMEALTRARAAVAVLNVVHTIAPKPVNERLQTADRELRLAIIELEPLVKVEP